MKTRLLALTITSSLLVSVITTLAAVDNLVYAATPNGDCKDQVLAVSALNRATHIVELLRTIKLLPSDNTEDEIHRYLIANLKNEVAVGKSLLVFMEIEPNKTEQTNLAFEQTRTGALLHDLLDSRSTEKSETVLPRDLQDKLGREGVALFNAVFRGSRYLREEGIN